MKPQVLKGFRDYLPSEMLPRKRLIGAVEETFQRFGFAPLDTPALEYSELLLGKYGDEGDKLLFRFLDNGERDVALRYDLTVPLARVLGANPEILPPFKRYQIAPVWRAEKPARGRFREFVQCDVDIAGVADLSADAEVVCAGLEALTHALSAFGSEASPFTLRLSNRKLLNGLCVVADIPDAATAGVFRTIDKLDKQGEDSVRELLIRDCGLGGEQVKRVFEFLALTPRDTRPTPELYASLRRYFSAAEVGRKGVDELEQVATAIGEHGHQDLVRMDLSIARGLDYYTGSIYETFLSNNEELGSIMSGGRYDSLLQGFTGKDIPAVGISIGLDRLLSQLLAEETKPRRGSPSQILVTVFSPELRGHSTKLANTLRRLAPTELYLGPDKLGKQFKYAQRSGIPYVVICGPDEARDGMLKIKNMFADDSDPKKETALVNSEAALAAWFSDASF